MDLKRSILPRRNILKSKTNKLREPTAQRALKNKHTFTGTNNLKQIQKVFFAILFITKLENWVKLNPSTIIS